MTLRDFYMQFAKKIIVAAMAKTTVQSRLLPDDSLSEARSEPDDRYLQTQLKRLFHLEASHDVFENFLFSRRGNNVIKVGDVGDVRSSIDAKKLIAYTTNLNHTVSKFKANVHL